MGHNISAEGCRGSILIVSVWMLALLFLLTVSVGRRANQELLLVKYSLQKMQARYLAWAGFHYAISQIRQDGLNPVTSLYDDQFACGVKLDDGIVPEKIFKEVHVGNGWFNVTTGREPMTFGMGDEDGKLNLNALNLQNYGIFKELLIIVGLTPEDAVTIAAAAVDWHDEDNEPVLGKQIQEREGPFESMKQEFPAKNRPYDHVYELMFLKGMTSEVYEKLKNIVTVFPRQPERLRINFATAPREVFLAVARYLSGPVTNTSRDDGDSLTDKILLFRAGGDRVDGTSDDQKIAENKMGLTMAEQTLFRAMTQAETKISRFLSFRVSGFEAVSHRQSHIDVVLDRDTLTVASWRND